MAPAKPALEQSGPTPGRPLKEDAMATSVTESDVIKMISSLSNWGRWGADDQLGTMNLITPAKRKRAAALVQDGVPVSCARPIVTNEISADTTIQPVRFMVDSGEGRDHDSSERLLQRRRAAESRQGRLAGGPRGVDAVVPRS